MSDVYKDSDFVDVVDSEGNPLPEFAEPVPKAWVGTDLLPKGAKAKVRAGGRSSGKVASSNGGDKGQQPPAVFDPSEHKQDEVLAHLATADADEVARVKAAEAEGDDRKGIAEYEPGSKNS